MKEQSTGKRLAKNTFFMYFRMSIQIIIALYTSRVVLQQLGVEDYGIYNLVGSVVAMFSSLRTLFASSTQRFLNYEMGRCENEDGDKGKMINSLNRVFNMSISINVLMSILFVICVEIVGFWFFNNKVNVDSLRLGAAIFVFQFSIAAAVLTILITPFDAEIIAHERMDFYAIMAIIEGLLKLAVAFVLPLFAYDKLELYGILLFIVHLFSFFVNGIYCRRHFAECRFKYIWDNSLFKKIFSFAGWNFLGNTAYTLAHNGINMVLNVYGGAVVNASRGIAYQVQSAVSGLLANISVVIRPYSIKEYAKGEYSKFNSIMFISSKIMFSIQLCLVILLGINVNLVLSLWLKEVPQFAAVFTQIILIDTLIRSLSPSIDIAFMSEGKMRNYQIIEGVILSLPLLASYILLRNEFPYYFTFLAICFFEIINLFATVVLASKETKLNIKAYCNCVILPCSICFVIFIIISLLAENITSIYYRLFFSLGVLILMMSSMWFEGFSRNEREAIVSIIRQKNS